MSFKRVFLFTCDICGDKDSTEKYGGPKDYKYYHNPLNGQIEHSCPICTQFILSNECGKIVDKQIQLNNIQLSFDEMVGFIRLKRSVPPEN